MVSPNRNLEASITGKEVQEVYRRYGDELLGGIGALQGPLTEVAAYIEDIMFKNIEYTLPSDRLIQNRVAQLAFHVLFGETREVS